MSADLRVWPRPLVRGDVVTVVAPSGPVDPVRLRQGAEIISSWGLTVRYGSSVLANHDQLTYLAGDDRLRAADFTAAWNDPTTAAVWAARGGYGAQRMVDLIDFDALRIAGPRHLVGFSDITALHSRIGRELGQVTVHGPVLGSVGQLNEPENVAALRQLLMGSPPPQTTLLDGRAVRPGSAEGRLWGGNLALLASDIGVEPVPDEPVIMIIEDTGEDAYRVDRMLTQLIRAGWLARLTGILVGDITGSQPPGAARRGRRGPAERPRRTPGRRRAGRPRTPQSRVAARRAGPARGRPYAGDTAPRVAASRRVTCVSGLPSADAAGG